MIKDEILNLLSLAVKNISNINENIVVTTPSNEDFGDYSTPIALTLGKKLKINPIELAQKIISNIEKVPNISEIKVIAPGFINIFVSKEFLIKSVQKNINLQSGKTKYSNKKVIIEYSSPNIAKPFTVGHLRSTIIGDALANLLELTGSTVYRDNHIGDWGTQFGKQIYAIKNFGYEQDIENSSNPVSELVKLYVRFHEEAEKNPTIEDEARAWFKKLEDGDFEARRLWKKCIDWSFKEFENIYSRLNVRFTENEGKGYGESFFEDKMQDVVSELKDKNLLKESKGAELVFFSQDKFPPLMILKQDGSTLYATRDLATDKFRLNSYRYSKDVVIINEVGNEQSLYFKQIYELEKILGWVNDGQRIHIGHGLYRFKDTKMSTRKGNTIWLKDVLDEAQKRALALSGIDKKINPSESSESIAESVGVGALKWNDLKRSPHLDIVFDWEEILSMQGNSGPYMQYTFARCKSLLKKSKDFENKIENAIIDFSKMDLNSSSLEIGLLRSLFKFEEVVLISANKLQLSDICTYLYGLAQKYNYFYQTLPILKEEDYNKRILRLHITKKTSQVIDLGLKILGIKTVSGM